jgi:hypothetical protein
MAPPICQSGNSSVTNSFRGGPPPLNHNEGDANGNYTINVADGVHLVKYIIKEGDPPYANHERKW